MINFNTSRRIFFCVHILYYKLHYNTKKKGINIVKIYTYEISNTKPMTIFIFKICWYYLSKDFVLPIHIALNDKLYKLNYISIFIKPCI